MHEIGPDVIDGLIAALVGTKVGRKGEVNAEGRKLTATTIRKLVVTFRLVMRHGRRPVGDVSRYLDECRPEWFRMRRRSPSTPGSAGS